MFTQLDPIYELVVYLDNMILDMMRRSLPAAKVALERPVSDSIYMATWPATAACSPYHDVTSPILRLAVVFLTLETAVDQYLEGPGEPQRGDQRRMHLQLHSYHLLCWVVGPLKKTKHLLPDESEPSATYLGRYAIVRGATSPVIDLQRCKAR